MTIKSHLTPDWFAPANIHAVSTLRTGGVSCGAYNSFNLAAHVGDDPSCVAQNRQHLRTSLNLPAEPVWLEQIHSNRVIKAKNNGAPIQADASYTDQADVVCAVMTADCLPVLLCSTDGKQVAAVHAGWRGLASGIISNTVTAMRDNALTLETAEFVAWLGPAIGINHFAVGEEVRETFLKKNTDYEPAFCHHNGGWLADIYQLARTELVGLGIHNITGGGFCTVSETERFYSYRRDKNTGRMVTLIWRTQDWNLSE